ncbi:MAG: hemolysin family protein [Kiritimatiellia bacterium]|nr:hemolysin family protein [Kiritimatiellia bacterium]MDP6847800.1 hemolysin family protein [Kiritimatiellia bacterium]
MNLMLSIECITLVLLFFCSAFFSSAETALFSLNPIQINRLIKRRPSSAGIIQQMLDRPTQLLSTILIGNTLVNVAASGLGYVIVLHLLSSYAEVVSIVSMTFLLLLVGEVAPKRLAMVHAERLAVMYAPALNGLIFVMTPLRAMLERVAVLIRKDLHAADRTLTEDEFLSVVEAGEEAGVLDEEERTMVDGIVRMEEMQASDIMTPRVDLVGIDLEDSSEEHERVARSVTFRYLPIYRETMDQVEGFLDVLKYILSDDKDVSKATIPPVFVPETAPLDNLLINFQRERRNVAFVSDEYGGTAGLITRGDILEEIAEDVENEYGDEQLSLQQIGINRWLIDGSISLEDVNYELGLELEAEGADRIGGWIMAQAERIPHAGDVVEAQGCRARVQRVRKRRVTLVFLERTQLQGVAEEESG